jgi:hypothetical protein
MYATCRKMLYYYLLVQSEVLKGEKKDVNIFKVNVL